MVSLMLRSGSQFLGSVMALTLAVLLLIAGVTEVGCQLTWSQLHSGSHGNATNSTTSPNPQGRRDALLAYDAARKQLVLFGGSPGPLGDTWVYSVETNTWREVNTTGVPHPSPRYGAVGGVSGHYLYLATGKGHGSVYYSDVWRFDLRNETWEMLSPTAGSGNSNSSETAYTPPGRYSSSGGIYVTGTRLYVSLGTNDVMRTEYTFAYDTASNLWFKENEGCNQYDPRCPHPRYLHSGVMTDREQFVVFSGCLSGEGSAGPCPSHDAWRYDGQTAHWTQLDSCPTPRLHGSMAMLPEDAGKRYVVLYGGQTDTPIVISTTDLTSHEVSVLDLHSGSWTQRQTRPESNLTDVPELRLSAAMSTGPDGIFLFGGSSLHGVHTNDLWLLRGNATDADQSPASSCAKTTVTMVMVHGILMAIGFGFLLPVGAILMRYVTCLYTHIAFQILGLCCAIAGLVMGVLSVDSAHFSFVHAIVGIVALGLGVLQPINALCRPKEPRPEERRGVARCVWQFVHRFGGRVSILLGLANGSLGVFLAVAGLPVVIAWHSWLGALVLVCLVGETVRCRRRGAGQGGASPRHATSTLPSDGIINGWEKGDSSYVNPATESIRL